MLMELAALVAAFGAGAATEYAILRKQQRVDEPPAPASVAPQPDFTLSEQPPQFGAHKYLIQRVINGQPVVEYHGYDSDVAVATWVRLEHSPDAYPGEHEFFVNDRRRAFKHESR